MDRGCWLGISVGRRIALLIVSGAITMGVLIGYVLHALSSLVADLEYSERFTLAPTEALPGAIDQLSTIKAELEHLETPAALATVADLQQRLHGLDSTFRRYRTEWIAADNPSEDARRFRGELAQHHQLILVDDERAAVTQIERELERLRETSSESITPQSKAQAIEAALELRRSFYVLLQTNIRFTALAHEIQQTRARHMIITLLILGLASLGLTVLFGLRVQRAIGPRISTITRKVRVFQETGEYERTPNPGCDDIALLSNALDIGFSAIRERDREREQFFGIAAHELKTPLTSIIGYAEAALSLPDASARRHAIEVIRRQAARLGRLVQDLLLAASARQGRLTFKPRPAELGELARRAIAEIENGRHRFAFAEAEKVYFLGDEELLVHAIWQTLSYASAVAAKGAILYVNVSRAGIEARLAVTISELIFPFDELERGFQPFASVQYEGEGMRYAVGLYLSREIARLHGGTIRAQSKSPGEAVLVLEIPA
jgi:signal transduction histidine kinase